MKKMILALALLVLVPTAVQAQGRRYVCSLWAHMGEAKDPARTRDYISTMKSHGFNGLSFDIHWINERPDGTYDFSQFDRVTKLARENGLDLFVRVNTSCTWGLKPHWLKDEHLAYTKEGEPFIRRGLDDSGIPSISNRQVLDKMAKFYEAVGRHCRETLGSGTVACFTAAFTLYLESEYWEQIDYSPSAQSDFRWWAKREYGTISTLNDKWVTDIRDWEELDLAKAHPTAQELYFEYCLKRFFYLMNAALKRGDPKAELGMQTGCLWDNASARRTANAAKFFDHVDWLFVADAPIYPHRFTCDQLRGISQGEIGVANEIDGPYQETLTPERVLSQGAETWEQGVDTLFICNWNLANLKEERFQEPLRKLGEMARQPATRIKADRAIYMSSWDLIHKGWGGADRYREFYDSLPDKDKRPVDIIDDAVIERRPNVLKKYKEIYLPQNTHIPEATRRSLEGVRDRLLVIDIGGAGTRDEYQRPTAPLVPQPNAGKRYYVNSLITLVDAAKDPAKTREFIDVSVNHGFNALSTDINWEVERPDGTYDFSMLDRTAEYALSKGLHLFVRISCCQSWKRKPYWLMEEHLMCLKSGEPMVKPEHGSGVPSICNVEVIRKMTRFHTAVAKHCREKFGSESIVCYTPGFTLPAESEFSSGLDYGPDSRRDFKQWVRTAYKSLAELNAKWGTEHAGWDDVDLVTAHPAAQNLFFEFCLDRWFGQMKAALREGDPQASFAIQSGCLWDDARARRTTNCVRFFGNVEWLCVADAPMYPHNWSNDHLRGMAQGRVFYSNEIDGPGILTDEVMFLQGKETYDHGVNTLFLCNWDLPSLKDPKWTALRRLGDMAKEPVKIIRADRAIYMSSWDLIYAGWGGADPYRQFYDSLPDKDTRPVDIISDSVFDEDPKQLLRYGEIYLPKNDRIPEASRKALLGVKDRLRIERPATAGAMDEYERPAKPLAEEIASSKQVEAVSASRE